MFIPERNIYQKFALFLIQILLKSSPVSGDAENFFAKGYHE
jgi:hypothetical protein